MYDILKETLQYKLWFMCYDEACEYNDSSWRYSVFVSLHDGNPGR